MKRRLIALLFFIALIFATTCHSEELTEAWVLCQPNSYINVRQFPKKTAEPTGYLMSGDLIFIDGTQKRGYMRIYGVTEAGEAWVSKGYIVYSEPYEDGHRYPVRSKGRVAARRTIGGTRRRWLRDGDILTVYMVSDEWCLTSQGFVKTDFIALDSRVDIDTPTNPDDMTWEEE